VSRRTERSQHCPAVRADEPAAARVRFAASRGIGRRAVGGPGDVTSGWKWVEITLDYDVYRRLAELLSHLGLHEALQELRRRAAASNDPDIREVAEDFTGRFR
jgi:hypothetical protein